MNKRTIIITGALGGIGQASIETFIHEKYFVIGFDIQSKDDSLVKELTSKYEENFDYFQVDCMDEIQVKNAIAEVVNEYNKIDVVFNVVGGSGRKQGDGPIDQCTMEGYQYTLDLNLKTQFLISKYAVQHMLKQGYGSIINMASVLGMVGGNKMFGTHTYAATKGAIIGFSRAMATYYAKDNIRVNVIAPGLIETPMSQRAQHDEDIMNYVNEKQPIYATKNTLGSPYSVAQGAVFLAHPQSDFVTGVVLPIDGGWTAQ